MAILKIKNGDTWQNIDAIRGDGATVSVGTVTTVSPSTPASVVNVGSIYDAVLNFSIPKGEIGSIPDTETYTIATSDWTALSDATPYTYQATVTATRLIEANTWCELINNQAVLFADYGFAIGSVNGQNITIYAIGLPTSSVVLEVQYNG